MTEEKITTEEKKHGFFFKFYPFFLMVFGCCWLALSIIVDDRFPLIFSAFFFVSSGLALMVKEI